MKLSYLYDESHDIAGPACDFYCDPKAKKAGSTKGIDTTDKKDLSFLKGGKKDRARFAKKMNRKK